MSPIIRVENLGKKYTLRHQGASGAGYRRFSEELLDLLKRPFQVRGERCKVSGSQVSGKELKSETSPLPSSSHLTPSSPLSPNTSHLSPDSPLSPNTSHLTPESFWALRDVSFDVQPGEVLGIIGRNGAGKSTLLKILSRITEPSEGRVTLKGRVASLLEVGTGFHPELTGRENVYLNGAVLGMSRAEIRRKFDEIVAFAEVEKFLDTPVKHYSSGMYVRLAFAVAAHLEPEILVVDEVLAVGDAEFQRKCLGKMSEVAHGGRTVLFVSHNMTAVQTLCKSAIRLDAGRLVEIGPVANVVASYNDGVRKERTEGGLSLGHDLVLGRFDFAPAQVVSGASIAFSLEVSARKPTRLHDCAILIYSQFGSRAAVLDLRQKGLCALRLGDHPVVIDGTISALPLVEGEYHVGLYLRTDDYAGRYLDITGFSVTINFASALCVPYPATDRGFVELDFDVAALEGAERPAMLTRSLL